MNIAIYGAGSLGVILGAYIARAGLPVDLVHHSKEHVEALRAQGARVTGTVSLRQPVNALLPSEMEGPYDIIFLTTKQLSNAEVVPTLKDKLSPRGVVCTLQNGLPEPAIAAVLGEAHVLGCVVEWGATLEAPGVSALTSAPDSLSFQLGGMAGKNEEMLRETRRALETMCPVEVEENFMGVRWSKLLINAAFSGMSAVLGCTFGEAAGEKPSRRCVQALIKECIDVARAQGIHIAPVQGKDIVKLLDYKGPIKKWVSFQIIPIAIKKHRLLKASMLQDLEKGRRTEVDAINGVVCAQGREAGISTPYNDRVVAIVHDIEAGKRRPEMKNVEQFIFSS